MKTPIRHRAYIRLRALDFVEDERRLMILIVHVIGRRVGRAQFGEVELQIRKRRLPDQLARMNHAGAHRGSVAIEHGAPLSRFIEEAFFHAIDVRGNEIDGDVFPRTIATLLQSGAEPPTRARLRDILWTHS